jgi:hypothetical protein
LATTYGYDDRWMDADMVDPERPGKRHLSWRQSIVLLAAILLAFATILAPWALPMLPYR